MISKLMKSPHHLQWQSACFDIRVSICFKCYYTMRNEDCFVFLNEIKIVKATQCNKLLYKKKIKMFADLSMWLLSDPYGILFLLHKPACISVKNSYYRFKMTRKSISTCICMYINVFKDEHYICSFLIHGACLLMYSCRTER